MDLPPSPLAGLVSPLMRGLPGAASVAIIATATRSGSSLGHNVSASFPAERQVGDLVLVIARTGGSVMTITSGTGWQTQTPPADVANCRSAVFWKILDGTGDNLSVGTSVSTVLEAITYVIRGASLVASAAASASTTTPNPPSLTQAMAGERLWIAAAALQSIRTLGAAPNGSYGNRIDSSGQLAAVSKFNQLDTDDPAAWAFVSGTAVNTNAWTIAVGRP
jgi:hypothetical protein